MYDFIYSYSFKAILLNDKVIEGVGFIQFAIPYNESDAKKIAIADVYKKYDKEDIVSVQIT